MTLHFHYLCRLHGKLPFYELEIIILKEKLSIAAYYLHVKEGRPMKLHSAVYSIFVVILLSSDAFASDLYSIAYVEQVKTASAQSLSRMTTEDIAGPMLQKAARLSPLRPAQGNLGLAWQEGDGNNSTIAQDGIGNIALVRQIGLGNTASITQSGSGHQAMILQQGRGNVATISQR